LSCLLCLKVLSIPLGSLTFIPCLVHVDIDTISVFSNMLKDSQLQALAEADEQQVVRQVQVSLGRLLLALYQSFDFRRVN
jgi:hypothetical protein